MSQRHVKVILSFYTACLGDNIQQFTFILKIKFENSVSQKGMTNRNLKRYHFDMNLLIFI